MFNTFWFGVVDTRSRGPLESGTSRGNDYNQSKTILLNPADSLDFLCIFEDYVIHKDT